MAAGVPEMVRRAEAAQKTLERYQGQPFRFGKNDCGAIVITHLRNMGHRPRIGPAGRWKSAFGLKRFLADHGGSGAACLDGWGLERIAPAATWCGDIIELPGQPPFGAFGVVLSNGRVLAYHEDAVGAVVVEADLRQALAAWRA